MADTEYSRNAHKRQKLGFEKYSNSKVLSDVTIRYGNTGKLKFDAHRLLLSAKSYWFEAAFTGGFANSAREITLHGDDPDALKIMLNFAYDLVTRPPENSEFGATTTITYFLGLYRVGDKYDFPDFLAGVVSWFKCCLHAWLNRFPGSFGTDETALVEFSGFVRDVYDLVGSERRPEHPLVKVMLAVADDQGSASILNNTGRNQPLILTASEQVAEFGRDILLHLMAKTGTSTTNEDGETITTELCIGVRVTCLSCEEDWWRVVQDGDERDMVQTCIICEVQMYDKVEELAP